MFDKSGFRVRFPAAAVLRNRFRSVGCRPEILIGLIAGFLATVMPLSAWSDSEDDSAVLEIRCSAIPDLACPAPPQFRRPTTPLATIRADPGAEHQCGLEAIRADLAYLLFDLEQDGDVDPGAGVTVERPDHLIRLRHLTGGPPMCAPKKGPHAPKPSTPPARPLARLANAMLAFLQDYV